jgi:hypothetical protein
LQNGRADGVGARRKVHDGSQGGCRPARLAAAVSVGDGSIDRSGIYQTVNRSYRSGYPSWLVLTIRDAITLGSVVHHVPPDFVSRRGMRHLRGD